jgi:arylsulfatase A-like enzyme
VDREHLVSSGLDLLPTLCDFAGIAPPPDLPGASLRPLLEGAAVRDWRGELAVITTFDGDKGFATQGRAVYTGRYKYVCYERGRYREQLFDLLEDPGEMVNLAVESRHAGTLSEHRRRLTEWCRATNDPYARQRSRMPPQAGNQTTSQRANQSTGIPE